jgi:hypothetical protein
VRLLEPQAVAGISVLRARKFPGFRFSAVEAAKQEDKSFNLILFVYIF